MARLRYAAWSWQSFEPSGRQRDESPRVPTVVVDRTLRSWIVRARCRD
jgi:hypothetical protein